MAKISRNATNVNIVQLTVVALQRHHNCARHHDDNDGLDDDDALHDVAHGHEYHVGFKVSLCSSS